MLNSRSQLLIWAKVEYHLQKMSCFILIWIWVYQYNSTKVNPSFYDYLLHLSLSWLLPPTENSWLGTTESVIPPSNRPNHRWRHFRKGSSWSTHPNWIQSCCQDFTERKNRRAGRHLKSNPRNLYIEDFASSQHNTTLRSTCILNKIIESKTDIHLIMEYAPGGELFDYIVKKKRLD